MIEDKFNAESFEAEKKNCGCGQDPLPPILLLNLQPSNGCYSGFHSSYPSLHAKEEKRIRNDKSEKIREGIEKGSRETKGC